MPSRADPQAAALRELLRRLDSEGYDFVAVTPASHARILARPDPARPDLRDIFGWSRAFAPGDVDPGLRALLAGADALLAEGERCRSRLRVARLGGRLLLHSAFPTDAPDAVFLGPDSYRFARLIAAEVAGRTVRRAADIGTGAGVGAFALASAAPSAEIVATDLNPQALHLARINAAHAGLAIAFEAASNLDGVDGEFDVIVANPPYIRDPARRLYRDGGGDGTAVALDMAGAAAARLAPGGRLILYTGAPVVAGKHALHRALAQIAAHHGAWLRYEELDPDVFGEELDTPGYAEVERIALVAAILDRTG